MFCEFGRVAPVTSTINNRRLGTAVQHDEYRIILAFSFDEHALLFTIQFQSLKLADRIVLNRPVINCPHGHRAAY